ncbi:MAG: flagellar biosynthetic protein FliO [Ignavibacteria bacterium]
MLKIIFFFGLILGLMYGALYLMRKYFYLSDKNKSNYVKIKILSTQMILPKKFIQVVQVNDKVLVLGVSDHSINLLQEFEYIIPAESISVQSANSYDFKENFVEIFKRNLGMK